MNITGKEKLRLENRQTRIILPPQRNPRRVKNLYDERQNVRG
jgi:hypothetical protein